MFHQLTSVNNKINNTLANVCTGYHSILTTTTEICINTT